MPTLNPTAASAPTLAEISISPDRLRQLYKAPHQAEFLCLQAEAETLVRQIHLQIQKVKETSVPEMAGRH